MSNKGRGPGIILQMGLVYSDLTLERLGWYETRPLIDLPHSKETHVLDGMKLLGREGVR